ncbi:4-hydroxy-tetrahydrodipicolinate synthase [Pseudoalteromonas sp. A25]|uniref:4-hydroxy-tetrahydrodipicolinate synthase n=1 Tax=Pseudoalteromonas sp. A25 TaxID=116092 RepID=UPI001260A3F0|nr:4-hydroxy-tetrahydrodipicolinate synthase [Pseudoalteromonas sp. A25]BBN83099.1 4-hydroxy-tetrahydrodipicolinate synthase [Pseudoalteromonas sp. A25]
MKSQFDLSNYPLWTALVTPFDAQGQVDYDTLSTLVAEQQSANNGLLILGSTGEGLALSQGEQRTIVEHVCALSPSVPIMVAVGGFNLAEQLEWLAFCDTLPIDAYLLGSPLYAKPGIVGQTQWFDALLGATERPCMIYNVPGRSAVAISPQVLNNLKHHHNLWAVKEASGDIATFEAFRQAAPNVAIFSGDDALMPYFAQAGAAGLVSVAANAWPEQTAEFVRRSLAGTFPNLFATWTDAVNSLFAVANPIPVKVLMHAQGKLATPNLRPPLTHLELPCSQALNNANESILSWN